MGFVEEVQRAMVAMEPEDLVRTDAEGNASVLGHRGDCMYVRGALSYTLAPPSPDNLWIDRVVSP